MDQDLQAIRDALVRDPPYGSNKWFVDFYVIPHVTSANVHDVCKLLSEHENLNQAFWSMVNDAPTTDEGWNSLMFIGSGMSDEALQEKGRQELRHAVEIVRATLGSVQVRRSQLFRRRP